MRTSQIFSHIECTNSFIQLTNQSRHTAQRDLLVSGFALLLCLSNDDLYDNRVNIKSHICPWSTFIATKICPLIHDLLRLCEVLHFLHLHCTSFLFFVTLESILILNKSFSLSMTHGLILSFLFCFNYISGVSNFVGGESAIGQQKWVKWDGARPRYIDTDHKWFSWRSSSPNTDRNIAMAIDSGNLFIFLLRWLL